MFEDIPCHPQILDEIFFWQGSAARGRRNDRVYLAASDLRQPFSAKAARAEDRSPRHTPQH
jgi:hypothetical protein